ncbi:MAG: metalloprotease TldD [Gammaproteobacteria bacterium]|jgi:TldD protein|nr:metalloprotease TldD [Gammaproteobacteria bacterium]
MQTNSLQLAQQSILTPAGVDIRQLEQALDVLMGKSIDAGELYFQQLSRESWSLEDGIVRGGNFHTEQGVGIRAHSGEKTGFAYADEVRLPALLEAARAARGIAAGGADGQLCAWRGQQVKPLYQDADPIAAVAAADKVALLRAADQFARSLDQRVQQVNVSMVANHEAILVAASDGTLVGDIRPLVRFNIHVIAVSGERREQGTAGGGGRFDLQRIMAPEFWQHEVREAVRQALVNLEAEDAPAGSMPVVLGPGWPGVLLHEAIGHGLEGDFNRKGTSAFAGRMGERVASELCTVVDDGTLPERRGSLSVDDEGTPTACTTLIENGRLTGYMQDKLNARLSGSRVTGNGRRESFAHLPMPRMTNTYMLAGPHDPGEIIASVENGLYAVGFAGGQVDITSGKFVFSASEAYLIRNGKISHPVRGATLIGNGPDVLTRVSMVGNDLALDNGIGVCGKEGQSVPVGVGQPTLKIDQLTVGGTRSA